MEGNVVVGVGSDLREVVLKKLDVVDANHGQAAFCDEKVGVVDGVVYRFLGSVVPLISWHMGYITDLHLGVALIGLAFPFVTFHFSGDAILIGLFQVQFVRHLLGNLSFAIAISVFIFIALPLAWLPEEPISGWIDVHNLSERRLSYFKPTYHGF
jgi:hypothetical protein